MIQPKEITHEETVVLEIERLRVELWSKVCELLPGVSKNKVRIDVGVHANDEKSEDFISAMLSLNWTRTPLSNADAFHKWSAGGETTLFLPKSSELDKVLKINSFLSEVVSSPGSGILKMKCS